MPDEALILVASSVRYGSQLDEIAFFNWLDRLNFVEGYRGELRDLIITLKRRPTTQDLRDLLALFHRYGVDMSQLKQFETRSNREWLRNPDAYWHKSMFGSVD
jgi:hypothetical protein